MITHTTHVVYTLVSKTVYSSSIFSYNQNFKSGKKGILQIFLTYGLVLLICFSENILIYFMPRQ